MSLVNDIDAELAAVEAAKDRAAANHSTSAYDNLCGRAAALRWVLSLIDGTAL